MAGSTETLLPSGLTRGFQSAPPTGTALPGGEAASPPSGYQVSLQVLAPESFPSRVCVCVCVCARACVRAQLLVGSSRMGTLMPSRVINMCIPQSQKVPSGQVFRFQCLGSLFLTQWAYEAPPCLAESECPVCLSVCLYHCLLFPRAASGLCSGTKERYDTSFACHGTYPAIHHLDLDISSVKWQKYSLFLQTTLDVPRCAFVL